MYGWQAGGWHPTGMLSCDGNGQSVKIIIMIIKTSSNDFSYCNIGIDLDPSKPKGMPFDLKLHTYSFTTKYINMAKA